MTGSSDRTDIKGVIATFLEAWESGNWESAGDIFTDNCQLETSHMSAHEGERKIVRAFQQDRVKADGFSVKATNHYVGGGETDATFSFYAYGHISKATKSAKLGFGMTVTGSLKKTAGTWHLDSVLIALNWVTGDYSLATHWQLPPGDDGWRIGDPAPTIVSELNAPWLAFPSSTPSVPSEECIAETYARYSWALDQADMQLLAHCFANDAAGDFQPMGLIEGRHAIIGSFKEFRRPWPWMQHFADVLEIKSDEEKGVAEMIVGRVIPGNSHTQDGTPLYGAHYRMRLRRKHEGFWQLTWSEYRPGWFNAKEAPRV